MIDIDALHGLLWLRSNNGVLLVHQRNLAADIGVNHIVVHRVLRCMEGEGRLRHLSGSGPAPRTYEITDPADWLASRAPTPLSGGVGSSTQPPDASG